VQHVDVLQKLDDGLGVGACPSVADVQFTPQFDRCAAAALGQGRALALRAQLADNTAYFRQAMTDAGFAIAPGDHPIVPIMVLEAELAQRLAARMLELGVYVVGFFFPVVPQGKARIRVQMSAGHSRADLEFAVAAFSQAGRELGLIA
jgi:7-keto-8-aminopelargonate synthetase-like enzyme